MDTKLNLITTTYIQYDDSIENQWKLYDNMPYIWDSSYSRQLKRESGNIIKAYRCQIKEPYVIKN